jgi:valyl-tRNA synthetase
VNGALGQFEVNQATKILYDFIWHDFCDWYVEMMKGRLYGDEPAEVKQIVLNRAIHIFDQTLCILHPIMPFLTEELWQHLKDREENESIMIAKFPTAEKKWIDKVTEQEMAFVQLTINSIRNIRGELSVPPSKDIEMLIRFENRAKESIIQKYQGYFQRLSRVVKIQQHHSLERPKHAATAVVDGGEIFIPLEGIIDLDAERQRIQKELEHVASMVESTERKLANESFVVRAPKEVVDKEREKLEHFKGTLEKLRKNLAAL